MYRLREWSVVDTSDDPYLAPEQRPLKVKGKVYDNPRFTEGEEIVTSHIVGVEGRIVRTRSGSEYLLDGPPEEAYVAWCLKNGVAPPSENEPIRVIS